MSAAGWVKAVVRTLAALAVMVGMSSVAHATDFECVWRTAPSELRAQFTRNTRSAADMTTMQFDETYLEQTLRGPMNRCGVSDAEAMRLGSYLAARALAVVLQSRLQVEFGLHEQQLDPLRTALTPTQQDSLVQMVTYNSAPPADVTNAVRSAVTRAGVSMSDAEAATAAAEFTFAVALVNAYQR
jgi:hypothetical protein